ncbi:MAG: YerC/YecD family TrpR-related protein [Candidatus Peregrinibacteria bacterium]
MSRWYNQKTQDLFTAVIGLKNENEAKRFFRDLLTEKELVEFGNRWWVAQMLEQKIPYSQISKKTGLSSTTVARISRWLNGRMGGYKLVLNRLHGGHIRPHRSG